MVVPLCRCRVLYIGSAVPIITKDGLQGIQQPLRERYPIEHTEETKGIDSWLSVWSNGILLEYIEGEKKSETAFFPINTLHYCAAVRYVNVTGYAVEGGGEKFLPLDSPFANIPDSPHPPIFSAIFRRTSGVKVLECHGFICANNKAANALVRCCFHAYADSIYLRLEDKVPGMKAVKENGEPGSPELPRSPTPPHLEEGEELDARKLTTLAGWERRQQSGEYDSVSISSTIGRGQKKASSEAGAARHAIVPYGEGKGPRRAGSETDLYGTLPGGGDGFPPHQHHFGPMGMPPGGPGGAPGGGPFPPPPHMMMGPGGRPVFFPPPHPFMMPPPGMRMPPPGMRFMPPPPPHGSMHPPPPHPGMRGPFPPPPPFMHHPFLPSPFGYPPFRPHSPAEPGSGPIITAADSIYGTIPRQRAYEEPVYMGGGSMAPPEASYAPRTYPHEQYDTLYDTYRTRTLKKGPESSIASHRGEGCSAAAWDTYEAGIYRRPHLNEKAFSQTIRSESAQGDRETQSIETELKDVHRPDTPPVDYEALDNMRISSPKGAQQNGQRPTAVMY